MITAILVFAAPAAIVALPAPMGTIAACCCIIGIYLREIQRENTAKRDQAAREASDAPRPPPASAPAPLPVPAAPPALPARPPAPPNPPAAP